MTALPLSFETQTAALPGLLAAELEGDAHPWLTALRQEALNRHLNSGLPSPRLESWKYTNLRDLTKTRVAPALFETAALPAHEAPPLVPEIDTYRAVLRNGDILSNPFADGTVIQGVRFESLAQALDRDPELVRALLAGFEANPASLGDLNTALLQNGYLINLDDGVVLDRPLELHHLADGGELTALHHARNFIRLGKGSRLQLLESFSQAGSGAYLRNPITRIDLAPGAQLQQIYLQSEGRQAFHLAQTNLRADAAASYDLLQLNLGAKLSRSDLQIDLAGIGASFRFRAAQILDADRHGDITTSVKHLAEETVSDQLAKQILDGAARGVYQGCIQVHPGAVKSDGHLLSRSLLLSEKAEADAKPELEIYADDVKCSHGCTFGDLDEDALFYLRSRGIAEARARSLLTEAFLLEIFEDLKESQLAESLRRITAAALHELDDNPEQSRSRQSTKAGPA